jgi:PGF-CTERM protein/surface glycoprotein (TIGR04207 family)
MTDQHDTYRSKGTALFLAAIMVLSMVAMAATLPGVAAAATIDRTPTDTTVAPGDTVTVTLDVTADEGDGIDLVTESFNNSVNIVDSSSEQAQVIEGDGSWEVVYLSPVDQDTIEVTYEIPEGTDGETFTFSGDVVTQNSEFDSGTTTVNVQEPQSGPFTVSQLDPAEADAFAGQELTVSADVTNEGDQAGDTEVRFTLDGNVEATQQVTNLDANDNTEVEFDITAPETPGDYTHGIETDANSVTGTLSVSDEPPGVEETMLTDFSVDGSQVFTSPADADRTPGAFDDTPNFGTAENPNTVDQTHTATLDLREGAGQELTVDVSESDDAGVVVDEFVDADAEFVSGDAEVTGTSVAGTELVVEFDANSNATGATLELTPTLADDSISSDVVTTTFDHEAEGPNGNTATDDYRLTNTGQISLVGDDGSDLLGSPAPNTNFAGNGGAAWDAWAGSVISAQAPGTTVAVFEAETTEDDQGNQNLVKGDRVLFRGTSPGTTTAIDTGTLNPNGEYLIEFDEDESQLVYLDLQGLNLDASVDDEVTTDDDLDVDITSNDIGQSDVGNQAVDVFVYEAGDDPIPENLVAQKSGSFDGDGSETISFDPSDDGDLDGTGDYYAVARHVESQNTATTDTVSVVEPLDENVDIVQPRQTDDPYTRGDLIEFELDLEGTDTATLTFGDRAAGQNVEINITVQTEEVGGTANFYLNTFQIGDGPVANETVRDTGIDGDEWGDKNHGVITQEGTTLVNAEAHQNIRIGGGSNDNVSRKVVLSATNYDLTASPGDTAYTAEGAISTDNSIVRLEPRETGDLQAWNAPTPGDEASIEDIEFVDSDSGFSIEDAKDQGLINPQEGVTAENDILILQFETTGLEGLLADQAQENDDLDEFLDRSEDHYVTDSFFDNNFVDLRTNQSHAQVEEIVDEARAENAQEDNLPADGTFGAQAVLNLEQEEVLAGTNNREGARNNLDEYYLTITVDEDNIEDLRANDTAIPLLDAQNEMHPDLEDLEIAPTEGDEIRTADERPVVFNTTFELGTGIGDTNASAFPNNGLFGSNTVETIEWELADDIVELDDTEETANGPRVFVPAQNNYTIEGETAIAAGTSMTSQTQTASGEDPAFFYPNEFTVEYVEDGPNTINFSEDFFDNDEIAADANFAGADFRMTIRRARLPGNLLQDAPRRGLPGTVAAITEVNAHTFEDQQTTGATVSVAEVNVSESAVVEIRDADGNALGSAEVPEGESTDVTVVLDEDLEESQELTSVILDTDGNEFSEGPVTQTAQVDLVDEGGDPLFLVQNLQPVSATVEPGASIGSISADIVNRGGAGEQTVELLLDGEVQDSQTVQLDADGDQTVTFEGVAAPDEEGTYTHTIASADDSAEGQLTVDAPDPANFQLSLESGPSEVETGDDITAEVTVENTGEVEGTQTITFTFDGEEIGSQEVTLGAGESTTESFSASAPDSAGDYDWEIASDDDSISNTLTVTEGESSDSNGPGFGIAAALVALLGAALLAYRRQEN